MMKRLRDITLIACMVLLYVAIVANVVTKAG